MSTFFPGHPTDIIDVDTFKIEIDLTQDDAIIDLCQDSEDESDRAPATTGSHSEMPQVAPEALDSPPPFQPSPSALTSQPFLGSILPFDPNPGFRLSLKPKTESSAPIPSGSETNYAHTPAPQLQTQSSPQRLPGTPSTINANIGRATHNLLSRTAQIMEEPPVKRQMLLDEVEPPQASSSTHPLKRSIASVIELDSDPEDIITTPLKKLKFSDMRNVIEEDSDEDYATLHAGLDWESHMVWESPDYRDRERADVDLNASSEAPPVIRLSDSMRKTNTGVQSRRAPASRQGKHETGIYVWDAIRLATDFNLRHTTQKHQSIHTAHHKAVSAYQRHSSGLEDLELTTSFKRASGVINKVAQFQEWTAICSTAMGGGPDEPDEELNLYNHDGNLIIWQDSARILRKHSRELPDKRVKYYSVNDIKFDSHSEYLISSGDDKAVRVWCYDSETERFAYIQRLGSYSTSPHDIEIQPESGIIAVAARKVHIYGGFLEDNPASCAIPLATHRTHLVGAMAWGKDSTSHLLFASSEPAGDLPLTGHHKALDIHAQDVSLTLDANEAGDAMGIDPKGDTLALFTRGEDDVHLFRLYDVRRQQGKATLVTNLEPFQLRDTKSPGSEAGEVNCVKFSPDGIYLAVSRDDNCTHLYDMRMIGRGVLSEYSHKRPARGCLGAGVPKVNPGMESFGVVQALWVESSSRRLGLITGGDDGCVRFWDPLIAEASEENGRVLAETRSDIGHFCLGDRYEGEHDLVVGDASGEVYIFDKRGREVF